MNSDLARFENGKIVIEIDADLLAHSQENAEWNYDGDKQCLRVTDKDAFAKAVSIELNRENQETGLTRIHEILDMASLRAVEGGCAGCEYDDGIAKIQGCPQCGSTFVHRSAGYQCECLSCGNEWTGEKA